MSASDYSSRVHEFMHSNHPLDEAGLRELQELASRDASFCLTSACIYAQPDKAAILVDRYGADIQKSYELFSDRHSGQSITHNLLEEALGSYRMRPDVDKSPAGQERLLALMEFLLQRGVSASPNPDPLENPVYDAALLARPHEAFDEDSPEHDWVFAGFHDEILQPFTAPYALIKKYQPQATADYERAVETAWHEQGRTDYKFPEIPQKTEATTTSLSSRLTRKIFGRGGP